MTATRTVIEHKIGDLHVVEWPATGNTTVVGLPGLGSSAWSFGKLADELPNVRLISPSLRGRGESFDVGGPTGLAQHAADVKLIVEQLDLRDVVLVGHSMGAFLAPTVAKAIGHRTSRIVLIDGGVPPKLPAIFRPWTVKLLFKSESKKANGPWESTAAMVDKRLPKTFIGHPELRDLGIALLEREMYGPEGARSPRMQADRLSADAVDTFFNPQIREAFETLTVPGHLVWAGGGKHDNDRPMYTRPVVDDWLARQPLLTAEYFAGNHITVAWCQQVIDAVAGDTR